MTNVLVRWIAVAIGLTVLAGCALAPTRSAPTSPDKVVKSVSTGRAGSVVAKVPPPHRILIMGASYTVGVGAVPRSEGYAYLLGAKLQWQSEVRGISGTGYLNPGPRHQGDFAHQLAGMNPNLPPSVVLLQGGRNDGNYPQAELEKAVDATIREVHQRFHQAKLVLLGPIPPRLPVDHGELKVEAAIGHVAHSDGVQFIDPISEHWITAANAAGFAGLVVGHPNNAGYAYIADRVAADLTRLLHLPATPTPPVAATPARKV
jgi:lysophospholipase L1-like esterase